MRYENAEEPVGHIVDLTTPERSVVDLTKMSESNEQTGQVCQGAWSSIVRPPAPGASISLKLGPDPRSARQARNFVRDTMGNWGLAHLAHDVCLAVSELVTNAIQHANSRALVTLIRRENGTQLRVRDESCSIPDTRELSDTATNGRGMQLISGLGKDWGVQMVPAAEPPEDFADGKVVWVDIPASTDQAASNN